jgi:hypothetical protein
MIPFEYHNSETNWLFFLFFLLETSGFFLARPSSLSNVEMARDENLLEFNFLYRRGHIIAES